MILLHYAIIRKPNVKFMTKILVKITALLLVIELLTNAIIKEVPNKSDLARLAVIKNFRE
jgi:hypothetical protein